MIFDVLLEELVLGSCRQLRPPAGLPLTPPDGPVAPGPGGDDGRAAVHVLTRLDADRSILKRCLPLCVIHVFPFAFSLSVCSCRYCGVCLWCVPSSAPSNTRLR